MNNGAVALTLALAALLQVVVRWWCHGGQLVEIGGSFRVPDVIAAGGARLREVGTTNRTHAGDYRTAVGEHTGALLEVHPSNYRIEGFVARVTTVDPRSWRARRACPGRRPGSGLLDEQAPWLWTAATVARRRARRPPGPAAGADLVTFSGGDKLLAARRPGCCADGPRP